MPTGVRQSPTKRKRLLPLALLAVVPALASVPAAAQSQSAAIEASYQLLSTAAQADGSYDATFAFTFTNTGMVDFSDMRVRLVASPPYTLPPPVDLAVGPLLAGGTASGFWQIQYNHPVETDIGLAFLGEAEEADGTVARVSVVILQEGAAQ